MITRALPSIVHLLEAQFTCPLRLEHAQSIWLLSRSGGWHRLSTGSYGVPTRIVQPWVERLCDVMSDLSGIDEKIFKVENKRPWQPGEPYYEIRYQVKVIIGAADLRVELWLNGQKLSRDSAIQVQWSPSAGPATGAIYGPMPPSSEDEAGVVDEKSSGRKFNRLFGLEELP